MTSWLWALLIITVWLEPTFGHGSLVFPTSRNAFDRLLPGFEHGKSSYCNCGDSEAGCQVPPNRAAMSGQPCFWFSQGCFIGCANCTGTDIQVDGMSKQHEFDGPHANCTLSDRPAGSTSMPTLPKRLWTMNRAADELSVNDTYRFHPWRAPGSAPVVDACGVAGGTSPEFSGPGHTTFRSVTAHGVRIEQGAFGSTVLPAASAVNWTIGAAVEVKWGLRFNHGGGYQFRLCPSSELLNEDCFQATAMRFVRGSQALEWPNGTREQVGDRAQYVDEGVIPVGFDWAMNPIPVIVPHPGCLQGSDPNSTDSYGMRCRQFEPPCAADTSWGPVPGASDPSDLMGSCSGNWLSGLVVDQVVVPRHLAPGAYVLGFRWDAEQTSQVWSSCADVNLVA